LSPYDWQGRPDGIRLHQRCEADWFDSFRPAPPRTARASLDAAYEAATEKQPDAVADVPDPTPPAAEAEKTKREAAAEKQPVEPPAQPDQPVSAPDPVPATESSIPPRPKGMLDGDYQRLLHKFRNQKAVQQFDAAMKERGRLH
jgi:hypothetical protein